MISCLFKCAGTVIILDDNEPTVVQIKCPVHGSAYAFKNDQGKWETGEQRTQAMKYWPTCSVCNGKFEHQKASKWGGQKSVCSDCQTAKSQVASKERCRKDKALYLELKKDNPSLLWREFYEIRSEALLER